MVTPATTGNAITRTVGGEKASFIWRAAGDSKDTRLAMATMQAFGRHTQIWSRSIHIRHIHLHLVDFYGKCRICRQIYHTWILWGIFTYKLGQTMFNIKKCSLLESCLNFDATLVCCHFFLETRFSRYQL